MGAIDKMRRREVLRGEADLVPVTLRAVYGQDEDAGGGAIGAVTLKDAAGNTVKIPKGSVITRVATIVTEAFASGGAATIALGYTGTAGAFKAATAYNDAAYTGNDVHLSPASAPIGPLAADVDALLTIAGAALTDGAAFIDIDVLLPRST